MSQRVIQVYFKALSTLGWSLIFRWQLSLCSLKTVTSLASQSFICRKSKLQTPRWNYLIYCIFETLSFNKSKLIIYWKPAHEVNQWWKAIEWKIGYCAFSLSGRELSQYFEHCLQWVSFYEALKGVRVCRLEPARYCLGGRPGGVQSHRRHSSLLLVTHSLRWRCQKCRQGDSQVGVELRIIPTRTSFRIFFLWIVFSRLS